MKANLIRRIALAVCLVSSISIYSCNKENSSASGDSTSQANVSTAGDDQQQVSNESEIVDNDANTALNGQSSFAGDNSSSSSLSGTTELNGPGGGSGSTSLINVHQYICDATITYDTSNNQRVITIVYDGTNCWGNRTRTGTVVITMPVGQHWKDAGATVSVSVQKLTITRLRDGKTIVLNGTKTITNVSGGLLVNLSSLQNITHAISGSLSITFDNNTQRTWNVSKTRVFTYDDGIVITTTGTHSDGTNNDIAEWGTTRFGDAFTSLISAPKVIRQDCDFRLVSGQNTWIIAKGTAVITYGLDADGNPVSCPSGTYYFKLVWTGTNGKTYTIIWPY
jgi:hypothetical protein